MEDVYIVAVIYVCYKLLDSAVLYVKYSRSNYGCDSDNSFLKVVSNRACKAEFLIYRILEGLHGNNKILTNLYISKADGSMVEIELVMINRAGVYVIESKDKSATISGNKNDIVWTNSRITRYSGSKRVRIQRFLNPIIQNKRHIEAIREVLGGRPVDMFSYIVWGNPGFFHTDFMDTSDTVIIRRKELKYSLEDDLLSRPEVLTEYEVEEIYKMLECYTHADSETKKAYKRLAKKHLPAAFKETRGTKIWKNFFFLLIFIFFISYLVHLYFI